MDLFGGARRNIEATRAQFGAAQADADDTRPTLTAELARQYIALRASRQRLEIARYLLTNQQKIADLTAQIEGRSEERSVGKECVRQCRSRCSRHHQIQHNTEHHHPE